MLTDVINCIINKYFYLGFLCLIFVTSIQVFAGEEKGVYYDTLEYANDYTLSEKSEQYLKRFISTRVDDPDSAMFYAKKSHEFSILAADSLLYVRSLYAIAFLHKNKDDFKNAIICYSKALSTARNNKYDDREKAILNGLALAYYYDGEYDEALKYNFESLALREKENDLKEIAIACNNIGLVYYKIKDFDTAIKYFKRAIDLKEQTGGDGKEYALVNLGLCYSELKAYDSAIHQYEKAIKICDDNCGEDILVEAFNGLGVAYYTVDELESAYDYFNKALKLAENDINTSQEIIALYNLARIEFKKNDFNNALKVLNQSQEKAREIDYRLYIRGNYQLYAEIYSNLGKYDSAFAFQKKYDSIQSEIMNEEVIQNLAKIQIEYKERENLETISLQKNELSKRTTLLILSGVIILLAIVILMILYKSNHHRRKVNKELSVANEKLSEANDTIERQNQELTDVNFKLEEIVKDRTKELKATNAALLKSNNELDNFIYKTSHDIRGPLATLQGVCNVALIDIKDDRAIDYFQKLGNTARNLNEILSKLLIINQINNSLISDDRIDFDLLIDSIIKEQKAFKRAKNISVNKEIDKNLYFKSDVDLLKIILNNLIGNSFKFYNTSNRLDSFVTIRIYKEKDLVMQVIDNGIGIEDKASDKIFEIFSKASEMADSAGLGLYLVKLAVEKLEGEIGLLKTDEGHTCFHVSIPQG